MKVLARDNEGAHLLSWGPSPRASGFFTIVHSHLWILVVRGPNGNQFEMSICKGPQSQINSSRFCSLGGLNDNQIRDVEGGPSQSLAFSPFCVHIPEYTTLATLITFKPRGADLSRKIAYLFSNFLTVGVGWSSPKPSSLPPPNHTHPASTTQKK